ncbi:MAG: Fic family protein [Thermodesulfobacteriota bacterium]
MVRLEKGPLRKYTPCRSASRNEIVKAIAIVHAELVLIHPFREGNGRIARLIATVMAMQAELPPLDFGGIKGKTRQKYFSAVQAGLDKDYEPMEKVFSAVISRTLRVRGKRGI